MVIRKEKELLTLSESEKRKYLFLKQVDTLNLFLERHAITKEQYDISYSGLVIKMNITEEEIKAWIK
jgi:hypothetical protein